MHLSQLLTLYTETIPSPLASWKAICYPSCLYSPHAIPGRPWWQYFIVRLKAFKWDLTHVEAMPWPVLCNLACIALGQSFFPRFTALTASRISVSGPRTAGAGWSSPTLPCCGVLTQLRISLQRPLSTSKLLLVWARKTPFYACCPK